MKKILTLPKAIVLLIAILLTGGCAKPQSLDKDVVEIYLRVVEINGAKHLQLYDSNDTTHVVVDTLTTDVWPKDKVYWVPLDGGGVEQLKKISPKKPGKIIKRDAEKVPKSKKFKLKIPRKAPIPSPKEKYDIVFIDKDGNTWPIDPYLRIPPEDPNP